MRSPFRLQIRFSRVLAEIIIKDIRPDFEAVRNREKEKGTKGKEYTYPNTL